MASRAILRRKKSLFHSLNQNSSLVRSFSGYENRESSKTHNSSDWSRSTIHQLPNIDDRKEENSLYHTKVAPSTTWGRGFTSYNSWEFPSLGSRTVRAWFVSPLPIKLVLDNQHYSSTAAAGQPDFGSGNDKKEEEAAIKKKKEPSPEECDQAVEGLSPNRRSVDPKLNFQIPNLAHRTRDHSSISGLACCRLPCSVASAPRMLLATNGFLYCRRRTMWQHLLYRVPVLCGSLFSEQPA